MYDGYIVDEIYCEEGLEYVKFTNEEIKEREALEAAEKAKKELAKRNRNK